MQSHAAAAAFGGDDLMDQNLPPPSTLAAQLVRNHAESTRGVPQQDAAATFRQLLQEILNNTSAPETDIQVNHKLIKVVLEAGLEVLFHQDPFPQWDLLLSQAIDSLAVIQSTIQRQPDILFMGGSQPPSPQHPHLLLWLIPKLLTMSKHPNADQLQSSLASLFSSMILTLSRSLYLWPHANALLQLLRDCVTDIFILLQNDHLFFKSTKNIPGVLLPPLRSTSYAWPKSEENTALPLGHELSVKDALSAIRIQLLLLAALRDVAAADVTPARAQTATFPLYRWISDSAAALMQVLFQHRVWLDQHSLLFSSALQVIRLQSFVLHRWQDTTTHSHYPYLLANLCESCSKLIVYQAKSPLDIESNQELASIVEKMVNCRESSECRYVIEEFMLPSFRALTLDAVNGPLRQVSERYMAKHPVSVQSNGDVSFVSQGDQNDVVMIDDASQPASSARQRPLLAGSQNQRPSTVSNGRPEDDYETLKRAVATLLGRGDGVVTSDPRIDIL
jgi:serine/threonine-protein kinase ATR